MDSYFAVVADCGGTNSRLQLYQIYGKDVTVSRAHCRAPGTCLFEREYQNEKYVAAGKTFSDIYREFVEAAGHAQSKISVASIAVAGPVENNSVTFTNNNWSIDGSQLASEVGCGSVVLMNDFVAAGYGILTLDLTDKAEVVVLQKADRVPGAPIACVGAGTGLGEVFLTNPKLLCPTNATKPMALLGFKGDDDYTAYPTEGGHTDFAPRSALEYELLQHLMGKFGQAHRVSVERVISGRGLAHTFEFLAQHPDFKGKLDPAIAAEFENAGDLQGKVVATHADTCPVCAKVMEIFVGAYGAEAGSCALKYLPFGGLFLAGGLTPKNLKHLVGGCGRFVTAFRDKGRLSPVLLKVPVYAIMDEALGQRGAHFIALKLLRSNLAAAAKGTSGSGSGSGRKAEGAAPSRGPNALPGWLPPFVAGAALAAIALRATTRAS